MMRAATLASLSEDRSLAFNGRGRCEEPMAEKPDDGGSRGDLSKPVTIRVGDVASVSYRKKNKAS